MMITRLLLLLPGLMGTMAQIGQGSTDTRCEKTKIDGTNGLDGTYIRNTSSLWTLEKRPTDYYAFLTQLSKNCGEWYLYACDTEECNQVYFPIYKGAPNPTGCGNDFEVKYPYLLGENATWIGTDPACDVAGSGCMAVKQADNIQCSASRRSSAPRSPRCCCERRVRSGGGGGAAAAAARRRRLRRQQRRCGRRGGGGAAGAAAAQLVQRRRRRRSRRGGSGGGAAGAAAARGECCCAPACVRVCGPQCLGGG
ncbi:hypothetical protein JKP88DRAFT_267103 [Tribonema minus]|uniref:Uncharacterized protein n=1 Tax=Tribonema minus TaxID=303371 RepID=A0A835ZB93_9STRA|nr:hypothetical protein JKP88DRAFT_267103 [Tribonema minus]